MNALDTGETSGDPAQVKYDLAGMTAQIGEMVVNPRSVHVYLSGDGFSVNGKSSAFIPTAR